MGGVVGGREGEGERGRVGERRGRGGVCAGGRAVVVVMQTVCST